MTQYALLCLILYVLSNYLVMAITPLTCNFKVRSHHSKSYKCPSNCVKSRTNPPDLRKVELNYRICTHPDIGEEEFSFQKIDENTFAVIYNSLQSRRKRTLTLVPKWQSEPSGVSVNQGKNIDLYCSIDAIGSSASYEWYYSEEFPSNAGDPLSELYNGVGDDSGTLTITSASSTDAGYYQCKVTDNTQDGKHIIYSNIVEVEINNYYLTTPSDGMETESKWEVLAQDVLILECPEIESNPPAVITWYKDNAEFSDQGAFMFPFSDSQTFTYNSETYTVKQNSLVLMGIYNVDNGKYKCKASNTKNGQSFELKEYTITNMDSSDTSLANALPTVLRESPVTVEQGSSATLYCLGVGHPTEMTYSWKKGNDTLSFSDTVVKSDFGRQVTFSSTEYTDAGLYSCTVENSKGDTTSYVKLNVEEPTTHSEITITEAPADIYTHDVYLDNPADIVIPCKATGADQIRFLKNGELLTESSRYTFKENVGLTFTSYDSEDSGVYQCVAYNEKYWKQKMTFVMITEKVSASASADVTLKDSDATLSCTVQGYPYPDVTWSKDGQVISNTVTTSSPYVVNSPPKHTLVIESISFTDDGTYTCTAVSRTVNSQDEDYSHSATSDVTLTIEEEISMTPAEDSVTATVDDTLTLGCTANAKPTPKEVTWYVNGTQITPQSGDYTRHSVSTKDVNDYKAYSTLEITSLTIEDGGTYKCEANNTAKGNLTTDSAEIVVLVKYLSVTADDTVREIAPGDAVSITCTAQGSPRPEEIKWYLGSTNGVQLSSSTDGYTITGQTNGTLNYISTLVVAKQDSNQDYVCEATNYLGNEAQFDEVKILVRTYTETQASRETSFVSTNEGQQAAMTCYCSGVPLPTEAVWSMNGNVLTSTAAKTITNTAQYDPDFKLTSVLTVTSPTSSDIAEFTCSCENTYQGTTHTDSVSINFRVVTPVSVNWDADNAKAAPFGQELKLTCTATGLPRPENVVWSRQLDTASSFSTIDNSGRFSTNVTEIDVKTIRSVLTMTTTEYSDDGTYKCFANNQINSVVYTDEETSSLLIYQNPSVVMGTTEYAAAVDADAKLTCTVNSKPAPNKLQWFYGNSAVSDQPTATSSGYEMKSYYTVSAVSNSNEGKYRCVGSHTYNGVEETGEGYTYVRLYRPFAVTSSTVPTGVSKVNEYSTLNITCSGLGVPEVSEFEWSIDSVLLSSSDITSSIGTLVTTTDYSRSDINIQVTSTLMINTVKYTNLGTYSCKTGQTWLGSTSSETMTKELEVNFDAKLFSSSGSTEVSQGVGSQVRLTCEVYGNPAPDDITWKWADGTATNDDDFTKTNEVINSYKKSSTLQFIFLPDYHTMGIECISKNTLSAEEEKLQFTLNMEPNTISILQSGTVASGETVSLTCLTTFDSGAISWEKDGSVLDSDSRISFSTNETYSTINSVLTIADLEDDDSGNFSCVLSSGDTVLTDEYIINLGSANTGSDSDGISTGIIIALVVLVAFIIIVIILIIVVFVHGRKRRMKSSVFDNKSVPDGYENNAYDDRHLQSVISMPDTTMDQNLPKVVDPIMLSSNTLEHDVKDAQIMKQATLTQQVQKRPRKY